MEAPAILRAESTERRSARYQRSFTTWSQSPFGFYVRRYYDLVARHWVTRRGPVIWTPDEIKALDIVFTPDKHDHFPFSKIIWLDIGQTGKTLKNAAFCQWMGMYWEVEADIQIIANSKEQSDRRVYNALKSSLRMHPSGKEIAEIQEQMIYFRRTMNRAAPIPMNAATQAGGSPVARSVDEWWKWLGASAFEVMAEIKETPARDVSLLFISSYMGFKDDDGPLNSQIDDMFDENDHPKKGVDQPDPDLPLYTYEGTAVWWNHDYKRYPWIKPIFLKRQADDPTVTPSNYLRVWEARRPERDDAFMPIQAWDKCEDEDLSPLSPEDRGVPMVICVDIGLKNDSSACVARGYDVETGLFPLLDHRIWTSEEYPDFDGGIGLAKQWILDHHRRHKVFAVYYDPYQFAGPAGDLRQAGVKMVEWTQNNSRTSADTNYRSLIVMGALRNYPQCYDLRTHVQNAVGVENNRGGIRLDKLKAKNKIDGAVADSGACWGCSQTEIKNEFIRYRRARNEQPAPIVRPPSPFRFAYPNRVRHG